MNPRTKEERRGASGASINGGGMRMNGRGNSKLSNVKLGVGCVGDDEWRAINLVLESASKEGAQSEQ